jgi:hypothetical protein
MEEEKDSERCEVAEGCEEVALVELGLDVLDVLAVLVVLLGVPVCAAVSRDAR